MMYPDSFDCHRLLATILRRFREQLKIDRPPKVIASDAGANEGDVSHLCRLDKPTPAGKRRPIGRATVIRILTEGFLFNRAEVDALLWLFDGSPLGPADMLATRRGDFQPVQYTSDLLRQHVVDLMGRVVSFEKDFYKASTRILFQASQESRLAGSTKLLNIESENGVLLLILTYPTPLLYSTDTEDILRQSTFQPPLTTRIKEWEGLQLSRNQRAFEKLPTYGMRCIHSRHALEEYFRGESRYPFSKQECKDHLDHWIKMATEHYPQFQIGLVEKGPRIEVEVKSTRYVVIRGALSDDEATTYSWGTRYIFFDDELSVLSYLWDFERQWLEIPTNMRGHGAVEYLRQLGKELTAV